MAITWRNIEAPSFSDSLKAGALAQQSFNAGFDNLNKILQERQATQEANWQTNQDNLKQGFLDALYGAKTPEELAALQQSGQLNQMLQGMAPQTREALRGQDEQRRTDLMNQLTQQQQFTDAQKEREARPIIDRLSMLANSEDVDLRNSAKAALGIYQGQGMVPNAGRLAGDFLGAERGFAQEARAVAEDDRSERRLKDQLLTNEAQREAAKASAEEARTRRQWERIDRLIAASAATSEKLAEGTRGGIGGQGGITSLIGNISSVIKDPDALQDAVTFVNTALTNNPDFSALPTEEVAKIVLRHADQFGKTFGSWDSTLIRNMTNDMRDALETNKERILDVERNRAHLISLAQQQRYMLDQANAVAFPELTQGVPGNQGKADVEFISDADYKKALEQARKDGRIPPAWERGKTNDASPQVNTPQPVKTPSIPSLRRPDLTAEFDAKGEIPSPPPRYIGLSKQESPAWTEWSKRYSVEDFEKQEARKQIEKKEAYRRAEEIIRKRLEEANQFRPYHY